MIRRTGNDVEHIVDAVAEVDVGDSAFAVHYVGAVGPAVMGVAGGVLLAQIAFGFGYAAAEDGPVRLTDTEKLPADGLCGAVGILEIEIPAESFH